jgi:acyl-CoA synthetase (NDP forming)
MVAALVECIVGIARDQQLGPVLLVGMGGVFAEVLQDKALRLPPISAADARAMLGELRGHELLEGARGRPAADVEALVDLLLHLSDLACEQRDEIDELDLNPVQVGAHSEGALAVDALVLRSAAVAAGSSAPVAASTTTR